jgi:hypothetical protein
MYSGRPAADGSYFVYVPEGSKYEISIDPEQSKFTYFAKQFDLTTEKIPQREKVNATLKTPAAGDELLLNAVQFKPSSAELEPTSETEIKRLVRFVKANPQLNFEVQVLLNGYEEDSIRSSPDLTEVMIDSVHSKIDDIDSLGQLYTRDTVVAKARYHNDRTQAQANNIVEYLVKLGANRDNLIIVTNAIPAVLPEDKKLTVKAVARAR